MSEQKRASPELKALIAAQDAAARRPRPPLDPVYVESLHAVARRYLEMYRQYGPEGSPLREQMSDDERMRVDLFHQLRETMSATVWIELCEAWIELNGKKAGD